MAVRAHFLRRTTIHPVVFLVVAGQRFYEICGRRGAARIAPSSGAPEYILARPWSQQDNFSMRFLADLGLVE